MPSSVIAGQEQIVHGTSAVGLGDILERILDKGIVIAGDITIYLADVRLLDIKIRLLIASVDKAKELGISWWERDGYLSPAAREERAPTRKQSLVPAKGKGSEPEKSFIRNAIHP